MTIRRKGMRSRRIRAKRIWSIVILLSVGIIAFTLGFSQGQQSVYQKAKNNEEILELYK
jgi:cell division protein FtsI/penicillin-binding protein 2